MNVLNVKTHKSNGRAWSAWNVKEETASGLEYLVSVNGKQATAYVVNDYQMGKFWGDNYERAVFDLTELPESLSKKVVESQGDIYGSGWVVKLGEF